MNAHTVSMLGDSPETALTVNSKRNILLINYKPFWIFMRNYFIINEPHLKII